MIVDNFAGIYTVRDTHQPYYWDIVFEWEDEFSKTLGVPLIPVGQKYNKIYCPKLSKKLLNRVNFYQNIDKYFFKPTQYFLAFHIGPPGVYSFHSRKDVIPIIVDFWKSENLKRFQKIFSTTKKVFITSKEVYTFLNRKKLKINLDHLSLSLPDKYLDLEVVSKDIDLIQIGRQNQKINEYVNLFLKEFPETNYVYTVKKEGKVVNVSSKHGPINTEGDRGTFINLLNRSKISLLSAPGLDEDRLRTGGFSPVTPRFLESAACKCFMVGVYPENDDFQVYQIDEVCTKVGNYDSFKNVILDHLRASHLPDYSNFVSKNLSSVRAKDIKNKIFR